MNRKDVEKIAAAAFDPANAWGQNQGARVKLIGILYDALTEKQDDKAEERERVANPVQPSVATDLHPCSSAPAPDLVEARRITDDHVIGPVHSPEGRDSIDALKPKVHAERSIADSLLAEKDRDLEAAIKNQDCAIARANEYARDAERYKKWADYLFTFIEDIGTDPMEEVRQRARAAGIVTCKEPK